MTEFGTPNEILPAPEGEDNTAYNAAVIQSLTKELVGPVERARLDKILWARLQVNELVQRIANLRALHKLARAEGYAAGLEAAAEIAEAIDSGRGNEKEIAKAIRALGKEEGQNDAI